MATLLEAAGVTLDRRDPVRTRARLEKALDTLLRDKVIAAWQYDRWDETLTTRRGWAHHWLQATILLEPPEVIRSTYQRLERHEAPLQKAHIAAADLGERLKQRRQTLGLTQIQAAEQCGVHQATWSRLERGQVRSMPALLKRLSPWLAAATNPTGAPDATHTAKADITVGITERNEKWQDKPSGVV